MALTILYVLNANVTDLTLCRAVYDSIAGCPRLACYDSHLFDVSIAQCPGLELCENSEFIKAAPELSPLPTCHVALFAFCACPSLKRFSVPDAYEYETAAQICMFSACGCRTSACPRHLLSARR